jgi:predicted phosphoribosyltransferase
MDCRRKLYRTNRPGGDIKDRVVIIVDDGIATGATRRRAEAIRKRNPSHPACRTRRGDKHDRGTQWVGGQDR